MSEILYRKIGKRYIPAGLTDIPHQEGVYIVQLTPYGRGTSYVGKLCDIPDVPLAGALLSKTDAAAQALERHCRGVFGASYWDKARIVLEAAAGIKKGECE